MCFYDGDNYFLLFETSLLSHVPIFLLINIYFLFCYVGVFFSINITFNFRKPEIFSISDYSYALKVLFYGYLTFLFGYFFHYFLKLKKGF